jgi:glycosyltransferase involved in cell wall biosynthesis
MSIAVVIPSRLAGDPMRAAGALYLDRALRSVYAQTRKDLLAQVVICVDPGMAGAIPARIAEASREGIAVEVVEGTVAGQAAALNAGLRTAKAEWLALLEDDDVWRPNRIAAQWEHAAAYDLVTCSQEEVSEQGQFVRINDFPTPSGWLLRAGDRNLPSFDESFRWHVDTDMLGQLARANVRRLHLAIDSNAGEWLPHVALHSSIVRQPGPPLVIRTLNPRGGMGQIARSAKAARQSRLEHEEMSRRYRDLFPSTGGLPW